MPYVKLSKPPEDLQVLIDAFNTIPSDRNYREIEDHSASKYLSQIIELFNNSQKEFIEAATQERIEEFPNISSKYAALKAEIIAPEVQAAINGNATWEARRDIENLIKDRRLLWDIVSAYWETRGQDFALRKEVLGFPFFFRQDGTIAPRSRILNIFSRISPERVRFCKICSTIFWAKKSNAWTCSADCAIKLGNQKRLAKEKRKDSSIVEEDTVNHETI